MTPQTYDQLRQVVMTDEGLRLKPYTDTVGKLSIGYGRNLIDVGISQVEARQLLDHDLETAISALTRAYPLVETLSPARQIVLASMCFNLGIGRLSTFRKMWASLMAQDYDAAAVEMLDSEWASQVGARASRLAEAMRSGVLAGRSQA